MAPDRPVSSVKLMFVIALCACALLARCATRTHPTLEASLDYGQFVLRQLPPEIDPDALKGKRIVIDPGHGGVFPGAVGSNNLREADVNLGVSLHLWGMLAQAGAEAHLTRAGDHNVYQGNDLDLKKDLQARAELAREREADLFVSLHHNADVLPGKKKNSLETYFKMSDPGPSLDAARAIHRQLALSLKQEDNVILPGNFHVLRENPSTAVLGEPSYISHERNAFRLGLAPMQRIEAQAYFLGIAEYFSKGVPKIEEIQPRETVTGNPRPLITARVAADRGVAIDPASISMLIDGKPVNPQFDRAESRITYLPKERLGNGKHLVSISLRNVNGNAARPKKDEVAVDMPAAYVLLDSNFSTLRASIQIPIRLRARVFDADLLPVADGTPVELRVSEGIVSPGRSLTQNGEAVAYFVPDKGGAPGEVTASATASGLTHSLKLELTEDAPEFVALNVVDAESGLPVDYALVSVEGRPIGYSDRSGYFAAPRTGLGDSFITFSRHGYESRRLDIVGINGFALVKMKPIAGGVLTGTRFVLDPRLGGEEKGATGPTGLRASDLNLAVANYLAQFLEASGANVALTRESDETVSALRRVGVEEEFDAEWFVSIGHGNDHAGKSKESDHAGRVEAIHYPISEMGRRLAASIVLALKNHGITRDASTRPGTDFVLTHTGSPAVILFGPDPSTAAAEARLRRPGEARREAYAIYCGILENLGLSDDNTGRISVRTIDEKGDVIPDAALVLDGAFNLDTGLGGAFTFSKVMPGIHRLEVYSEGMRLWSGEVPAEPDAIVLVDVSPSGPAVVSMPGAK